MAFEVGVPVRRLTARARPRGDSVVTEPARAQVDVEKARSAGDACGYSGRQERPDAYSLPVGCMLRG